MTSRREVVFGAAACLLCLRGTLAADNALSALEARSGGRLGVAALDTETGARVGYREDERFAMCSTFKLPLAAAVLARIDLGELHAKDRIPVRAEDLVPYAPVTEPHAGGEMTLLALCEAAVVQSDNVAANLLLGVLGGPAAWTAYARSRGDTLSQLDRIEPELNSNLPGDPRDTTTPAAMLSLFQSLLLTDALSERSRAQLVRWMIQCETGRERLRAGLPPGWRVGDKTGTSNNGATNDIAIVWPAKKRAPWLITAYYNHEASEGHARNAVLAEVARSVRASFAL